MLSVIPTSRPTIAERIDGMLVGALEPEPAQVRAGYAYCPTCAKAVAPGGIVTCKPTFSDAFDFFVVQRLAFCTHCHLLWWWDQRSTSHGTPLFEPLDVPPTITRDRGVIELMLNLYPRLITPEDE